MVKKYEDRNWEKGIQYGRVFAALHRHLSAWWERDEADHDSGLHHLWHAGCCLLFLIAYEQRGMKDYDDRPVVDKASKDGGVLGGQAGFNLAGQPVERFASTHEGQASMDRRMEASLSGAEKDPFGDEFGIGLYQKEKK